MTSRGSASDMQLKLVSARAPKSVPGPSVYQSLVLVTLSEGL